MLSSKSSPVQMHSIFCLLHSTISVLDVTTVFGSSACVESIPKDENHRRESILLENEDWQLFHLCTTRAQVELSLLLQDVQHPDERITRSEVCRSGDLNQQSCSVIQRVVCSMPQNRPLLGHEANPLEKRHCVFIQAANERCRCCRSI